MNQHISTTHFVAYYRVSTTGQGQSGLGLEAQQMAVGAYLAANAGSEPLAEFTEVESGKKRNRPELTKAIKQCKRHRATLIIAKLDRLARNVHFISGLMESRVNFVACDNPHANRLMVHMLAAFAEHEREMISQRTKDGLQAAKARGVELGTTGTVRAANNQKTANDHALAIFPQVREAISMTQDQHGRINIQALTQEMNIRRIPTVKGGIWHRQTVYRLTKRFEQMGLDPKEVF